MKIEDWVADVELTPRCGVSKAQVMLTFVKPLNQLRDG